MAQPAKRRVGLFGVRRPVVAFSSEVIQRGDYSPGSKSVAVKERATEFIIAYLSFALSVFRPPVEREGTAIAQQNALVSVETEGSKLVPVLLSLFHLQAKTGSNILDSSERRTFVGDWFSVRVFSWCALPMNQQEPDHEVTRTRITKTHT